jgi:hypothetical protein
VARAAQPAVAQLVVKQAGSRAVEARAALRVGAAARAASLADAAAEVVAETLGAAALNCGGRRSRRTLNPRSSFYPPFRCSDWR